MRLNAVLNLCLITGVHPFDIHYELKLTRTLVWLIVNCLLALGTIWQAIQKYKASPGFVNEYNMGLYVSWQVLSAGGCFILNGLSRIQRRKTMSDDLRGFIEDAQVSSWRLSVCFLMLPIMTQSVVYYWIDQNYFNVQSVAYYTENIGFFLNVVEFNAHTSTLVRHLRALPMRRAHFAVREFERIARAQKLLDRHFSLSSLVYIWFTFVAFTCDVYSGLYYLLVRSQRRNWAVGIKTTGEFACACLYLLQIHQLTRNCVHFTQNANKFNDSLYMMLISKETVNFQPLVRLHVAYFKPLEFTAYSFFKVNSTVIYSIVTASCTYLIILFQLATKD